MQDSGGAKLSVLKKKYSSKLEAFGGAFINVLLRRYILLKFIFIYNESYFGGM